MKTSPHSSASAACLLLLSAWLFVGAAARADELPVPFDSASGVAKMQPLEEWNPFK